MIDSKKLKKHLGSKLSSQLSYKEEAHQVILQLKGTLWSNELLASEIGFLGELEKANKNVKVILTKSVKLGVYSVQWLTKLNQQLSSNGSRLELEGLTKYNSNLVNVLGAKLSA